MRGAAEIRRGERERQLDKVNKYPLIHSIHAVAPPDYPEDPYYHGLSARVPVFGGREKEMRGQGAPTRQAVSQGHWWQDRMYPSGELKLSSTIGSIISFFSLQTLNRERSVLLDTDLPPQPVRPSSREPGSDFHSNLSLVSARH